MTQRTYLQNINRLIDIEINMTIKKIEGLWGDKLGVMEHRHTHTHVWSVTRMLLMCCTQNAIKFGKFSSGHSTAVISQATTARTGHGATDWFKIGKGVCQGCIL